MMNLVRYGTASLSAVVVTILLFFLMQTLIANGKEVLTWSEYTYHCSCYIRNHNTELTVKKASPRSVIIPAHYSEMLPISALKEKYKPVFDVIESPALVQNSFTHPKRLQIKPEPENSISLQNFSPNSSFAKLQMAYPEFALENNIEGYVTLEFSINQFGNIENAVIVESHPEGIFEETVLNAIQDYQFYPPMMSGQAVEVSNVRQKFTFQLAQKSF